MTKNISNTFTIQEQLSEVSMYPNVHDEDPHPQQIHDTAINVLGQEAFKTRHLDKYVDHLSTEIKITNPRKDSKTSKSNVFLMQYPEPHPWYKNCRERFQGFFRKTEHIFQHDKEVIICLSHGNAVNSTVELIGVDLDNHGVYSIHYGSTTILKSEGKGKWTMVGKFSTSEHLALDNGEIVKEEGEDF